MLLAVDPGESVSGLALLENDGRIVRLAVRPNGELLEEVRRGSAEVLVLEQIASYGQRVGRNIFSTVYFSGRLWEAARQGGSEVYLVPRIVVRRNLAGTLTAGDKEIRRALLMRFPELAGNRSFSSHAVQALGLAHVFLDYVRCGDAARFKAAA